MFCGLPVMVPVEPTFAAVAKSIRWGIGSNFIRRARCNTSGVIATQTTSFMRNAESTPERAIVTASRPFGVAMRRKPAPTAVSHPGEAFRVRLRP